VEEKRKKKMRANVTNDDDRRRFPSLGGGNDDEGTCFPRVSPPIINSEKNGLHSGDDDSSSAFFYLVRVWEPRKGEKKKKKNAHFCHLPHHGDCNGTSGRLPTTQESLSSKAAATGCEQRREKKKKRVDFNAGDDGGTCFHRAGPKGITAAHHIYKAPKGQHKGMGMVKKKRVDYVLTMEQQRTGTHFSRMRPHSL
jgi:hypothetical protein